MVENKRKSELVGRTAPPAGASICINPITFSPVHGTVLAPIYHTERYLLRSTSRANALTIQNFSYISTGTFLGTHSPDLQSIQSDCTTATSRYYCHITNITRSPHTTHATPRTTHPIVGCSASARGQGLLLRETGEGVAGLSQKPLAIYTSTIQTALHTTHHPRHDTPHPP